MARTTTARRNHDAAEVQDRRGGRRRGNPRGHPAPEPAVKVQRHRRRHVDRDPTRGAVARREVRRPRGRGVRGW